MIVCVACVVVLGAFYVYQRSKPSSAFQLATNEAVLFTAGGHLQDTAAESAKPPTEARTVTTDVPVPPETAEETIKVYITGAVCHPGVYEVPIGSRVDDVVQQAGGATAEADLLRVNLAAYVADAQQIIVPNEDDPADMTVMIDGSLATGSSHTNPTGVGGGDADTTRININTADLATLQTLPGIGPTIAQNIIDYREANGHFAAIDEIKNVSRIGDVTFDKLKDKITV